MRAIFLSIISISQIVGAILTFWRVDASLRSTPYSASSGLVKFMVATVVLIYLLGLFGGLLIWTNQRWGVRLSLIHEIALIPIFIIPNSFFYVLGDFISIAVAIGRDATHSNIAFAFNIIGPYSLLQMLNPIAGLTYYGVNVFAVICIVYLNRVRRRMVREADAPGVFG